MAYPLLPLAEHFQTMVYKYCRTFLHMDRCKDPVRAFAKQLVDAIGKEM